MSTTNTSDNKRFMLRSQNKSAEAFFIPAGESGNDRSSRNTPPQPLPSSNSRVQSVDMTTSNTESIPPARRVVVIRNTKNSQNGQGTVDLSDFNKSNTDENPPLLTNGNKSVYVIRRPIGSETSKPSATAHHTVPEPTPTNTLENARSLPSSNEVVQTFARVRPSIPSGHVSPAQPKINQDSSSKIPADNSVGYVPYLRRSRSKTPTANSKRSSHPPSSSYKRSTSPAQEEDSSYNVSYPRHPQSKTEMPNPQGSPTVSPMSSRHLKSSPQPLQSPSSSPQPLQPPPPPPQQRRRAFKQHSQFITPSNSTIGISSAAPTNVAKPPTIRENDVHDKQKKNVDNQRNFTFYSLASTHELNNPTDPVTVEHEEHAIQNSRVPQTVKNVQRKEAVTPRVKSSKSAKSTRSSKSAKSIIFINPDDQSIAVVEKSFVNGESMGPITRSLKPPQNTRFTERHDEQSSENLLKVTRRRRCLNCLARHICLIIIICFILFLIGLAGVGVSAYFYIIDSSNNSIFKIVGIAVGGALAIGALLFLCILLACIGSRDGYFTYSDNEEHIGGRTFALIPPTHPNAHRYIPRDYTKLVDNPPPTQTSRSTSNIMYGHPSLMAPVMTMPHNQQQKTYAANSSTVIIDKRAHNDKITIEMPERLVTGRELSPRTRERSLNKVVKNIGNVVEDAKKRYNGDTPKKVVIQIDQDGKENA